MRRFWKENSLSIVMFGLFLLSLIGQIVAGFKEYNDDQQEHGKQTVELGKYFTTGHFVEAVFENWESEFLQMGMYVVLTVFLRQKGSPESKKFDEEEDCDAEPDPNRPDAPAIVRRGGWPLKLYKNSLSLALFALFFLSFLLHAYGGARNYNEELDAHHSREPRVSTLGYLGTSRMWFESFENWQSEFLSIGALVVLSVFLRQKGSPESKPVDHPHDETGSA